MLNITRAIWAGAIAYGLNLTALSVLSNLIGPFMQGLSWAGIAYQVIVGIVTFGATFAAATWYFKGHTPNPTTGLMVGGAVALTSLVVTIVQVIPAIIMQGGSFGFIGESLKNWPFWVIVGVTLVAGAIAGMQKKAN
jgi:magnesium-transporting ATPase (P-type)